MIKNEQEFYTNYDFIVRLCHTDLLKTNDERSDIEFSMDRRVIGLFIEYINYVENNREG